MIYYNSNTINGWNYGSDNIVKVYRNNAVCYYKITGGGDTPTAQTPCFAVVDDISQYSYTEFEDVFNKADNKWYKLNNLNQYEEYGVYGSGRTITYYDGKLTIDNGYEYQYSGGSWNNVGEVSGGTATLPDVPFSVNYNANNYDANTKTLLKTSGQLADVDAVITAGTPTVNDGYLTIASGTRATISGYQTYFNRTNSAPNLTIISKQRTDGSNCHMFANRDSNYNWMYRCYSTKLTLHGASEQGSVAVTTQPVIESVRIDSNRLAIYNNYTNNTSSTQSSFNYGSTNSGNFAMFQGYATRTGENFVGDFYWVYMSQNTLTDDQVQQVIAYNEGGGREPEYPLYYDEMQDPPNNVSFSSMAEAEAYECPWVGMQATIDGTKYIFSGDSQSGYEWVEQTSRLPQGYTEVEYVENTSSAYLNLGVYPYNSASNSYAVEAKFSSTQGSNQFEYLFSCEQGNLSPYVGFVSRWQTTTPRGLIIDGTNYTSKNITNNQDGTSGFTITSNLTNATNTTPITLFCGLRGSTVWRSGKGKVYSFKVTINDNLVRDMIPCKRDNDNMVGMYDIVNDVFYTVPSGYTTDKLLAGNPV